MRTDVAAWRTTVTCASTIGLPSGSRTTRLVTPKPFPVSTIVEASWTEASAIAGLPTTIVSAGRENFTLFGWFMVTSIPAPALAGAVKLAAARSTAIRIDDLGTAIKALHAGGLFNGT